MQIVSAGIGHPAVQTSCAHSTEHTGLRASEDMAMGRAKQSKQHSLGLEKEGSVGDDAQNGERKSYQREHETGRDHLFYGSRRSGGWRRRGSGRRGEGGETCISFLRVGEEFAFQICRMVIAKSK
ncbi:unnamed protein product [Chondrus crispus]|uniref:Uncharacterized protein n=1 Tax=Chondrus crispus TaxID=2769 RepID=R7QLB8_CHOCR|nr:unnamed protein product [Chondrus crispus]CDF38879.1 unnamed protein product [Chondrus crispus]|eukprot:XP_005718784.1 unnamed protein product [Chondrus crispus]